MVVHKDSRFKGSYILKDTSTSNSEDIHYVSPFRERMYDAQLGDIEIIFEEGMRVDLLAYDYYGNELLDWVIMDANPQYVTHHEMKPGDKITIPNPQRVMYDV